MATLIRKTSQFGFSYGFFTPNTTSFQDTEIRQIYVAHAMAARLADDAEVSVRSQPRAAWSIAEVGIGWDGEIGMGGWGWGMSQIFLGRICGKDVSFVFFFWEKMWLELVGIPRHQVISILDYIRCTIEIIGK